MPASLVRGIAQSTGKVTSQFDRYIAAQIIREHGSAGFHAPYRDLSPSTPINPDDVIRVIGFGAPQVTSSPFSVPGDRIDGFENLRKWAWKLGLRPDLSTSTIESLVWTFGAPAQTADNVSRYGLWLLYLLYTRLDNPILYKISSRVDSNTVAHAAQTNNLFELYKELKNPIGFAYLYEMESTSFYVVSFDEKGKKATVDGLLGEIVPEEWKYVEYVEDVFIGEVAVPIFKVKWNGDKRVLTPGLLSTTGQSSENARALQYHGRSEERVILDYVAQREDGTVTAADILADPVFEMYHAKDGTIYTREQIKQRMMLAEQGRLAPSVKKFRAFGSRSTAIYRPNRQEIHDKILEEFFEGWEDKVSEHPTCVVLGGRCGSGKSKFNGAVYDTDTYLVLDPDKIKERLPEYPGWNADLQLETSDMMEDIIRMAVERKINVVLEGTMNGLYDLERRMQYFSDAGYRMEAHYMFVPRREAAKRALMRFLDIPNHRYVSPEVVLSMTEGEKNFDIIKEYVDAWSFSDNSRLIGSQPKLVARKGVFSYEPKHPTWLDAGITQP